MGNVLRVGPKTRGHIDEGLEVIAETRQWLEQSEGYYPLAWTAYVEAVLHLKRGSYFDARLACTRGLEFVERKLHAHPGQTSLLHTLLASICYEFDEIEQALAHLELALGSVNEYGPADAVIVAYLTQARIQHLRHDESGALAILREGQELGEQRGLRRVTLSLPPQTCPILPPPGPHH